MGNQGQDGKYLIGPRILNPFDENEVFTILAPDFLLVNTSVFASYFLSSGQIYMKQWEIKAGW